MKTAVKILSVSILIIVVLLVPNRINGQDGSNALANAEYGDISEIVRLRLHKVFVLSGDLDARDLIIKEIAKDPWLQIVSRGSDADFVLGFEVTDQVTGASVMFGTVNTNRTYFGLLIAARPVSDGDMKQVRILWHKSKRQAWTGGITLSRHPAVNAIKSFLGDLKKARKETPEELPSVTKTNSAPVKPIETNASVKKQGLTFANYDRLKTGMTYIEIVEILGAQGRETGRSEMNGNSVVGYRWTQQNKGGLRVISIMMNNDKLISKAQVGLD